jgi:hypothetical protein
LLRVGSIRIPEVLFDAAAPAEIHFADNLEKGKGGFEASGVRLKAANGGQVKTGQRMWPGTWFFYPIFS